MLDSLFDLTPQDRITRLRAFLSDERSQRMRMSDRHPKKYEYWQHRIEQVDGAMTDLDEIEKMLPGGSEEKGSEQ